MYNLRFHVGDVTQTTATVMYSTLVDSAVSLSVSTGVAVDSGRTDIHANGDYIGTGSFSITGLSALTRYTFTISQGAESYSGSFRTMPADQTTAFSLIFQTCTNWYDRGPLVFKAMRDVVEAYQDTAPVVWVADIDDVCYVDSLDVDAPSQLTASSGEPQSSGLQSDYANAWATWHGHEPTFRNFQDPDFQWVLRNVARGSMGGDHMVEGNHCRGEVGSSDYQGCDRTLEATAKTVWDAFIGDGNPTNLTSGTINWTKEIGPVRFATLDEFSNCDPYDGANAAEARATHPLFGATQLSDVMTYLDVDSVPFKCLLMSTGFSRAGQPWAEWWIDEADDWHANALVGDDLDGTSGWFFGLCGDNHAVHAQSFHGGTGTGFWCFYPGTTGASQSVSGEPKNDHSIGTKTGKSRYFRRTSKDEPSGSVRFGAFLHVIVHADETPKRLQCRAVEIGGNVLFDYELTATAGNDNQWVTRKSAKVGF
jgi:hypothetical protein